MQVAIKEIVDQCLKLSSFKRKGLIWYRDYPELIQVVGLQKSRWGNKFYISVAIWVKFFGDNQQPKVSECHLQCRLDALPSAPPDIEHALIEEDYWRMDYEQRREVLGVAFGNAESNFFNQLQTLDSVKLILQKDTLPRMAVRQELRAI